MLFPAVSILYFPPCPLGDYALRSRAVINYPSCLVPNGACSALNTTISTNTRLTSRSPLVTFTLSRNSSAPGERSGLLWRYVWPNEHPTKLSQLLRATDFLREQRELNDMKEFVVEFVGFVKILLLHLVADVAVFAVGCFRTLVMSGSLNKQPENTHLTSGTTVD